MRKTSDADRKRLAEEIESLDDAMPPTPPTIPATRNDTSAADQDPRPAKRGSGRTRASPSAPGPSASWSPTSQPELPADVDRPAHAARAMARLARASADGPGDRQPDLAAPLRRRAREDGERLRHEGRPAEPSGIARLAGELARAGRLAAQAAPPADRPERRVPAVEPVAGRGRGGAERPREPPALALRPAAADGRGDPRRHARRLGTAEPQDGRPERHGAGRPRAGEAPLQALAVAGHPGEDRPRPAADLPDRQAQPAAAVHGDLRRAGVADELLPARVEHARPAGPRAAQRLARQRPGRGLRRPAPTRSRRATRTAPSTARSAWPWAAPRHRRRTEPRRSRSSATSRWTNSPWPSST